MTLLYKAAAPVRYGNELLPLSQLRDRYPTLYAESVTKYAVCPAAMEHVVHPLACRWTDVLFFSPVHPEPIFAALRESGRIGPGSLDYWTLDATALDPSRTCILLKRFDPEFPPPPPEDFLPYDPQTIHELATPTERALHRLRTLDPTEPLLPWADIPHVLYRGSLPFTAFRTSTGTPGDLTSPSCPAVPGVCGTAVSSGSVEDGLAGEVDGEGVT